MRVKMSLSIHYYVEFYTLDRCQGPDKHPQFITTFCRLPPGFAKVILPTLSTWDILS